MKTTIIIILALSLHAEATVRGDVLRAIDNDHVSKFLNAAWNDAEQVSKEFNIPMGLLLAQACLESKYGQSRLAVEENNFMGIKYNHKYATFKSRLECFRAYGRVLNQSCYKELEATSLNLWLYNLEHCKYHLSKTYSKKIRWIYYKFKLNLCDNWKNEE